MYSNILALLFSQIQTDLTLAVTNNVIKCCLQKMHIIFTYNYSTICMYVIQSSKNTEMHVNLLSETLQKATN